MAHDLREQMGLRKTGSATYSVGWHHDWTLGSTLFGGSIAAVIHLVAVTHLSTDPELAARNQPDVLNLHMEFLRPCNRSDSIVTVKPLKLGAVTSSLQLLLSQREQVKIVALITSTNFDTVLGPTGTTAWSLFPSPKPVPDFAKVAARQSEPNWLPAHLSGEIFPITRKLMILNPRGGFPVDGVCDAWYGVRDDTDQMDATYVSMMTDMIPSMSDTLLRNEGLYDAHAFFAKIERWAEEHPGVPAEIVNTLDQALQASVFNSTVTLDIEFKRRVPEGLRWLFSRVAAKMLHEGRMDIEITLCNDNLELICSARQLILVLEAGRKFKEPSSKPQL
ncbi:thioesterase family protein [Xylariaceae sp. FL1019]|nr:thioesterase family protein [Xylariaceae sp. FL1019]